MRSNSAPFLFVILFLILSFPAELISGGTPDLTTKHFTFIVTGSVDTAVVNNLAAILESNYARITGDLNTIPFDPIEVNIYSAQWRYILATGNWSASGHIEGPAKLHFVEDSESIKGNWKIALHEFTHAVFLKRLIDAAPQPFNRQEFDAKYQTLPVWLWEAVSVYEADQFRDPKTLKFLTGGTYPSLKELNDRSNGKIYACGYTLVEFIHHRYGKEQLLQLINRYGDVQAVLGVTEEEFTREWYRFILAKYLK
jgi:hypothetical protein